MVVLDANVRVFFFLLISAGNRKRDGGGNRVGKMAKNEDHEEGRKEGKGGGGRRVKGSEQRVVQAHWENKVETTSLFTTSWKEKASEKT